MTAWTCPICGTGFANARSSGSHLRSHPTGTVERQDFRLWLAVAFADRVAVDRAADQVIARKDPGALHSDDRLAVGVVCVQRGRRTSALTRLGMNWATQRHLIHMVDNDLLPEIGCYELPPGVHYIDNDKATA